MNYNPGSREHFTCIRSDYVKSKSHYSNQDNTRQQSVVDHERAKALDRTHSANSGYTFESKQPRSAAKRIQSQWVPDLELSPLSDNSCDVVHETGLLLHGTIFLKPTGQWSI